MQYSLENRDDPNYVKGIRISHSSQVMKNTSWANSTKTGWFSHRLLINQSNLILNSCLLRPLSLMPLVGRLDFSSFPRGLFKRERTDGFWPLNASVFPIYLSWTNGLCRSTQDRFLCDCCLSGSPMVNSLVFISNAVLESFLSGPRNPATFSRSTD